jgi:hypothetical protein
MWQEFPESYDFLEMKGRLIIAWETHEGVLWGSPFPGFFLCDR